MKEAIIIDVFALVFFIAILVIAGILTGCATTNPCENPEHLDSKGGCSARWM